jgi:hypothetical protein
VRVIECRQLTPELAVAVAGAAVVVLADAAVGVPTVQFNLVRTAPARVGLTHSFTLADLLALSRSLDGTAPPGWELALPADDFRLGAAVSPRCAAGVAEALALLAEHLPHEDVPCPPH